MAISVGDAILKLGVDTTDLEQGMKGLGNSIKKHQKAIGIGMVAAGGVILAGLGASLKAAADFEAAMREVNTMMGLSQEEFKDFSKEVQSLASDLGVDAVDSAKALYQAISAGVPKDNAIEFLAIATKAAIGGVTDTATAVDGLSTVINAFKLPLSDTQKVADLMFTTVKGGKTTFEELSASLFQVAPIAAASGVSFEEVSAALATMTKQGVPTKIATTQLRQAMVALQKPTADMAKVIEEMGYESGQAMLEELGFAKALNVLRDATGGSNEMLMTMFGSVEAGAAVLALTGDNALMFADDLKSMANAEGAATDAFNEMEESATRQMAALKASFKDVTITVGNVLLPILKDLLDKIKPIIESIRNWTSAHPGLTKVIVLGTVAFGVLLAALGTLLLLMPGIIAAVGAFGFTLSAAIWPVTLVVAAVATLAAGLVYLGGKSKLTEADIKDFTVVLEKARIKLNLLEEAGRGTGEEADALRIRISLLNDVLKDTNIILEDAEVAEGEWQALFRERDDLTAKVTEAQRLYNLEIEKGSDFIGRQSPLLEQRKRELANLWAEQQKLNDTIINGILSTEDLTEAYRNATPEQVRYLDAIVMQRYELEAAAKTEEYRLDTLRDAATDEVRLVEKVRDASIRAHEAVAGKASETHQKRMIQIDKEYRASLSDIERGIQDEIDAIDDLTESEDDAERKRLDQKRVAELKAAIAEEEDADRRATLEEQLTEQLARIERRHLLDSRDAQKDALREELQNVRDGTDSRAIELGKQRDARIATAEQEREDQIEAFRLEREDLDEHYVEVLKKANQQVTDINEAYKDLQTSYKIEIVSYHRDVYEDAGSSTSPDVGGGSLDKYQYGGLITEPTLLTRVGQSIPYGIMAERRPEYISEMGRMVNIYVELDGKTIARAVGQPLVDIIRVKTGVRI